MRCGYKRRQAPQLKYDRCCVDCDDCVEDLNKMNDDAVEVTYHTMLRNCEDLREWATAHGYDQHLRLHKDWHVSFHRSKFKGQLCHFLRWSGIEYIWTAAGVGDIASSYGVIK